MKRVITILGLAVAASLFAAASAFAHVTAQPPEQPAGGFTKIEFRVPSERDVPTTKVDIQIPEGVDFVSVQPVPGWTFETKRTKLDEPMVMEDGDKVTDRISEVVFSGGTINAGEFQSFYVSMKLPEKGELGDLVFFPTIQTYQGGEEVSWVEKPKSADDDSELEKPAPKVTLTSGGDAHGMAASSSSDTKGDDSGDDHDSKDMDKLEQRSNFALVLSIAALAVALVGMIRGRKRG